MRARIILPLVVLSLLGVGLWWWRAAESHTAAPKAEAALASRVASPAHTPTPIPIGVTPTNVSPLQYRLSNTTEKERDLLLDDRVVQLANAVIDVRQPEPAVPAALRAPADSGTWIVVARHPLDQAFRSALQAAGASVMSYIPNNAELVRASAEVALALKGNALVESVLPYHPYYKLTDPRLLALAVNGQDLPGDVGLRLSLYPDSATTTLTALQGLRAEIGTPEPSPFGTEVTVHPAPGTFLQIARLDGVMDLEATHSRLAANDMIRTVLGVATNAVTNLNYLNLTGANIVFGVADSDVDATHPDLAGRLVLDSSATGQDTNGHGTHVIATMIGNGSKSSTVGTNASGSVTNANFRGIAPAGTAMVMSIPVDTRPRAADAAPASDALIQETMGASNVSLVNLSWYYFGDSAYDMSAASYDAAVRDSIPELTGPQAIPYIIAAGNSGGANPDGTGGIGDSINSPGTSKNAITVGAEEELRNITNIITKDGQANSIFVAETDSSNQVADISSRGNVGIGIEGGSGRFKPDVIAPGVFTISAASQQMNKSEYYNPTNFAVNELFNQAVAPGSLAAYSVFLPTDASSLQVFVVTNQFSLNPLPPIPVYAKIGSSPGTNAGQYDYTGFNTLTVPGNLPLAPGGLVYFTFGNVNTNVTVSFDLLVVLTVTNDNGNYLNVLSNMNTSLGPWYRYESGTSMSTAAVSGLIGLMKEFFSERLGVTNPSPALLKALLINGARSENSQYDFNVQSTLNSQGWGVPILSNCIPGALTNANTARPMWFYDQTNMLATGQSQTQTVKVGATSKTKPMRVTLVWTDPPGNPAAGLKLVNSLVLVVTNLDTGDVYYGNDIPAGSDFNETIGTNGIPNPDVVNNVQNVYLFPPLATNYSVTVQGRRVNVNAVTSNTNNVVQDYALVLSVGDGGASSNALTITSAPTVVSNTVANLAGLADGVPLLGERVGANSPYALTTNGTEGQWNFYIFTNMGTNAFFTNVAFVTFSPQNLGVPRMGTREVNDPANGVRQSADVDLYVSQDPTLTNLNPAAINNAFQSVSRTGTQKVLLTNSSPGQVYYIGVKAEDQEGGQYGFLGVSLTNSFNQTDTNGNTVLTVLTPLPTAIPPGTPNHPGSSLPVIAVTTSEAQARKVVVEDTITHQEFGDLVGVINHNTTSVVLNNHSFFTNLSDATEGFVYDDSGEQDPEFPGARHTDGPGTLNTFIGDTASDGVWLFSMINDSSPVDTGSIDTPLNVVIEPQTNKSGAQFTIPGDSWYYNFVVVPPQATNLTVTVSISATNAAPLDLYLKEGGIPTATSFDKFTLVNPPGTNLSISIYDFPPLNPGIYYIGIFNPNSTAVTATVNWTLGLAGSGIPPLVVLSPGNEPLADDAVTYSTNHVGVNSTVVSAEVGVRINHPRVSDLALTLIAPSGKRVLLAENRGGDTTNYGAGIITTNFVGAFTTGTFTPTNTVILLTNSSGTLEVTYDFFTIPDDMRIYYGTTRIFDSGLISGSGNFTINYGPGSATNLTIDMNEPGTNPNGTNGDAWQYQVADISQSITYALFTEDTNKTTTPIKFAVPPFGQNAPLPVTTVMASSFEVPAQSYAPGSTPDGWAVSTIAVLVVNVPALAATEGNSQEGNNVLALHQASIARTLPTVAGNTYTLSFVTHGRPVANGPVGWWKGQGDNSDVSGNFNNGTPIGVGAITYPTGLVGEALDFNGANGMYASNSPSLQLASQITGEAWINTPGSASGALSIFGKVGTPTGVGDAGYQMGLYHNLLFGQFNSSPAQFWALYDVASPSPVPLNTWTHVAWTYNQNVSAVYVNGQLVNSITIGPQPIAVTTNNLFISGNDAPSYNFFNGLIDEATLYSNALSIVQIQDIYAAGGAGKLPVGVTTSQQVNMTLDNGTLTNVSILSVDAWQTNVYTFVAPSNGTVLTFNSVDDGVLLDSFQLTEIPPPNPLNAYLPEEPLTKMTGESSEGDWKLEVLDNRAGPLGATPTLVSWELSLVLERTSPAAPILTPGVPVTNTVPPGFISYYRVEVPPWAQIGSNTLITASQPVNLLFDQTEEPGNGGPDFTLLPGSIGGTAVLNSGTTPPLPPSEYYLGVQNTNTTPVTFSLVVNFDILTLTNMVPYTSILGPTTVPQYFHYVVSSNAVAVAYQILNPGGSVELVASKGFPVPDLANFAYKTAQAATDLTILVSSNSTPVPLTPGDWYLGVFGSANNTTVFNYTIEASELGMPTIIPLTNDERFTTNFSPAQSLTTFFSFTTSNFPTAFLAELYQMNGNVDLALDLSNLPFAPPYFAQSANAGTNGQQIVVRTNQSGPGTNLNGLWYLAVPNNTGSNVTFTVHEVESITNAILVSGVPITLGVVVPPSGSPTGPTLTWPSVNGENYEIDTSTDFITWTFLATIQATGSTATYTDPNPITGVPFLFFRIKQIP